MNKPLYNSKLVASLFALGSLTLQTSCSDKDFDMSSIDTTIGIGSSEGLTLPTCDTEEIKLDDILELDNSDIIKINENGDYVISKDGEADASHPSVNIVNINESYSNTFDLLLYSTKTSAAPKRSKARRTKITPVNVSGSIVKFEYTGNNTKEIVGLTKAKVNSTMTLNVQTSGVKAIIPTFKTLKLTFPDYMTLNFKKLPNGVKSEFKNNVLTLENVPTNSDIALEAVITELDFTKTPKADEYLTFDTKQNKIDLKGAINASVSFDEINTDGLSTTPTDYNLKNKFALGKLTITSATGKFDPEIDLNELGDTRIDNIPDFLSDGDVKINLHNPMINVEIDNDVDLRAFVSGVLIAKDENGNETARVNVPNMTIKPNSTTKICICKYADEVDKAKYDEVKEVANLSSLLTKIPRTITFDANAKADATRESTIDLGVEYSVKPKYSIEAPLAFDEGAQIVYNDTIDGWSDDLEDIEFGDNTSIELTADVENKVPAALNATAFAIDRNGKKISEDRLSVEVVSDIKGSTDGTTAVTSTLKAVVKEKQKGTLKNVDGLAFHVKAASGEGANAIVGKTINAYKQTLVVKNIKVKVIGTVIADLN